MTNLCTYYNIEYSSRFNPTNKNKKIEYEAIYKKKSRNHYFVTEYRRFVVVRY